MKSVWAFFWGGGGDGLYKSIFGGTSFESRRDVGGLLLEWLLLFTDKDIWKDISI